MGNKKILIAVLTAVLMGLGGKALALQYPHDASGGVTSCAQCHKPGGGPFYIITSFENLCFNNPAGCHRTGGVVPTKKWLARINASNRFNNLPSVAGARQSSHGWKMPNTNPDAGVTKNVSWSPTERNRFGGRLNMKIYCTRCHSVMGAIEQKFLRKSPKGNYICLICHSSRRIGTQSGTNVRDPLPSSINIIDGSGTVAPHYSHPVEMNYSTAIQNSKGSSKYDWYESTPMPTLPAGYDESARPRLYTTYNGTARAVICQTCHGPMHAADSNPYTFDNLSSYSKGTSNYSSSAGNLLRQYPATRSDSRLCQSCHKVQAHKGFACGRCHAPHKKANEPNRYLIQQTISTPNSGKRAVQFISTSAMADRWTNQGVGGISDAICQVCHTTTKYQRNYSTTVTRTGGGNTGHQLIYDSGTGKYQFCTNCHLHTAAFSPVACGSCHIGPPYDTYSGYVIGRHNKHVRDKNGNDTNASYKWSEGALQDDRRSDAYGFSCGRCHNPWSPYTSSRHRPSTFSDSNFATYTAEVGFKIGAGESLPKNPRGSYTRGAAATIKDPGKNTGGSLWSVPATGANDGRCNNLYCHGDWYNGYTGNNPSFTSTGAQGCGKCHGASRTDPPGKMWSGGVNWGAHPRHVGSANDQQYGYGTSPNFRCNACHRLTATMNNETTHELDRSYHVNGRVDIAFDQGNNYPGDGNSSYDGLTYGNATSRKPDISTKPAYRTCRLIYCHSDGSRTQGGYSSSNHTLAIRYPNWSSSRNFTTIVNGVRRCSRCHGNSTYRGITAAMPGYATRPGKGNSHETHIKNGLLCRACHGQTVNPDYRSIYYNISTKHVNKRYDISIAPTYDNGGAYFDGTAKRCYNVKCHAGKTTPTWGTSAVCQNCHLSTTGDEDKRILDKNIFQSFSETAPKIYSAQWGEVGHGSKGRDCTNCHRAEVKHGTSTNRFRLYTGGYTARVNALCEDCHGLSPGNPGVGTKTGIQTHASSVTKTGKYNFFMRCVDCHDPHGDNNKFMVHSTVARPYINSNKRAESSNAYGSILANATSYNIDFTNNVYTSDYARKFRAPKICQNCHRRTADPSAPFGGRFRWYSAADKTHGGDKCTNCHQHSSGFKGAGCNNCHGWPPTSANTLIGRPGNPGEPMSGSTTAGAHFKHYTTFINTGPAGQKYTRTSVCGLCHKDGMYPNGAKSADIEIGFNAFNEPFRVYTTGKYRGQSAVATGFYGYSGKGASIGMGAGNNDNTLRCQNVKCHGGGGWLTKSFGNPTAPVWNDTTRSTVFCGSCHGAKKARQQGTGTWPTTNAHERHAGINTDSSNRQYDFMCKLCHSATVQNTATTLSKDNHVNAQVVIQFDSADGRVAPQSKYTSGGTEVNTTFGSCVNVYCHSRGTRTANPYSYSNRTALANYTAIWTVSLANKFDNQGERCSFCHGNKTYKGITAAMPNYTSNAYGGPKENSHKKHVVDNGILCTACHGRTITVDGTGKWGIIFTNGTTRHVNRVYDVAIQRAYSSGATYSGAPDKICTNVKCHGGKPTPKWGNKVICQNCHLQGAAGAMTEEDSFTFNSFSGKAARIYSTEWTDHGHGRSGSAYPFSGNQGANKTCTNCHKPAAKHGASNNYFRLNTSIPDMVCLDCHGTTGQLGKWNTTGWSTRTGIQSHTWANISTNGYKGGINKAAAFGGWNFGEHDGTDQKKVKCVDCHDPHGDRKNNYMLHSYINMSGSDRMGRPKPAAATAQMLFTAVGGPQMNWSSYVRPTNDPNGLGICQRCHSNMSARTAMVNFNKELYSNHNRTNRCTKCHKHRQGFTPSGCDACHGYPPPPGPSGPPAWAEKASDPSTVGLHTPHAKNPRSRPGIDAENDVADKPGFMCNRCHWNSAQGDSPTMNTGKNNADMKQLTSVYGDWSPGSFKGITSVTDDTCRNIWCHTPRYYQRTWKKPTGCDSCHGYRNKAAGEAFNIQTTGSHKTHINYSTPNIAGTDAKKYGLRCTMCHVENWPNYTTHYSSKVNMRFRFGLSTAAVYNRLGNATTFKGFTTAANFATCSKVYCHGRFQGGTTVVTPTWGVRGLTGCTRCHKSKANAASMPGAHPLHVRTVASSGYEFPCSRCHARTIVQNQISTLMWNYSAHVNRRKDVYFDSFNNNDGGTLDLAKKCRNTYCHSSGYRSSPAGSFTTRTTLSNYTAYWYDDRASKTGNKPCSYCHGNKAYNGITAAMPNQTSLWGNSHRTHVIGNKFRCQICHSATVDNNGAIKTSDGNHVNGFKNVTILAAYKQGLTLYSAQVPSSRKTCKNVRCHAGKTTPRWGTYAKCQDCHLSNTADVDKRISTKNPGFQNFTETAPRIYSADWGGAGHGSKGRDCTNCHKASVAHGTANNPFRLYTLHTGGNQGNPNALCSDCHGLNPGNPQQGNKKNIQTHASSVTKTGRHNFAMKCVDCHDPHGDSYNKFMLHSTLGRYVPGTGKKEVSNAYGQLLSNITVANVDFTNNNYTSDYARKYRAPKVCQTCHRRTYDPIAASSEYLKGRFRWYSAGDKKHGTDKCTGCHTHGSGFKGQACNGCHGFPPTSTQNILSGANRNTGSTERPSGNSSSEPTQYGAHSTHIKVFGRNSTTCSYCHYSGMWSSGAKSLNIDLEFNAFTYYTTGAGRYRGHNQVASGFYGYSGKAAGAANGTRRCESVKCHGGGGWLTKSFGNPTAPVWSDTTRSTVFCGSCHGAKKGAGNGTWPTTNAHAIHAGTDTARQQDLLCRNCHGITVLNTATTLNNANHVSGTVQVKFTSEGKGRIDGVSSYSGDTVVNSGFGKCTGVYCHSKGTDRVAPYDDPGSLANFTATWSDKRGSYKAAVGSIAKCKYCHGNKGISNYTGVLAAMPNYPNGSPKANKHPKHVAEYNFLCTSCHDNVVSNNTSIKASGYGLHVNRAYNVDFNSNTRGINNSLGRYTSVNSGCRNIYCHSRGTKLSGEPYTNTTALANYTAHWDDSRGGYKNPAGSVAKCNYCHGNRSFAGMTSAMPNYMSGAPKANRHPMHVRTYGFACTVCHEYVTNNSTSIDASGGTNRHVNQSYNIDFKQNVPGRFTNNTGSYTYQASLGGGVGSKCRNTYCHSMGTDFTAPFNTRTSFANWTAGWGDDRGGYNKAQGQKARCNYCHGNRAFSGITAAMPNYSGNIVSSTAKANRHPMHVRYYGFPCRRCHINVTQNNTSIDASGGTGLHVNQSYNVNFDSSNYTDGGRTFTMNNTGGSHSFISGTPGSKCTNIYCHSRGADFTAPFNTRTSFANWTARWGDDRGGYNKAQGQKARCNYCHGNRAFSGITAAMPNYSGNAGARTAKANSHRKHVIDQGFPCSRCHYGVAQNNTSISDRTRHVNGFYNISIAPGYRDTAGKTYSTNWTDRTAGGTCMRNTCHGSSNPKWGDPSTASCKACHFANYDNDDSATPDNSNKARIYSSEFKSRGHGRTGGNYPHSTNSGANKDCTDCHRSSVPHGTAANPFRLYTMPDRVNSFCKDCHKSGGTAIAVFEHTSSQLKAAGYAGGSNGWARWNFSPKCVDCHDPHGDNNNYMVHRQINYTTNSNKYGQWGSNARAQVTFTTADPSPGWGDYQNASFNGICQRCHTATDNVANFNKGTQNISHNSGNRCVNCHTHKTGFRPGGESKGGMGCSCHSSLVSKMVKGSGSFDGYSTFHHVLMNITASYENKTSFGGADLENVARRCLMCHVDHRAFNRNEYKGKARAANLRYNAGYGAAGYSLTRNFSGINTDFWPAKRRNVQRLGDDAGTANYSSTYPVSGSPQFNGVCISCHKQVQYKNTTYQRDVQTGRARPFPVSLYTSSSHNFQVASSFNNFSGGSSFRANCSKCHKSRRFDRSGTEGQMRAADRYKYGLHDSRMQSLLNVSAIEIGKPRIEQLCYKCHSKADRSEDGPGAVYEYYSSVKMNSGAKMIRAAIENKRSGHPIDSDSMAPNHKPDERYRVPNSYNYNRSDGKEGGPGSGWNRYGSKNGWPGRHSECVDCHNTHGGNATIERAVGTPNGGKIAGAQKGVWGVKVKYPTSGSGQPTYSTIDQVESQYEICLKCHSAYGYYTAYPMAPSGGPDIGSFGAVTDTANQDTGNNWVPMPETDVGMDFHPAAHGYHPVMRKGRNQPPRSANTNWPSSRTNWMYYDYDTQQTKYQTVSGLSWAFVPPFSQHSILACSDCHQVDNTGKMIAKHKPASITSATGWTNATIDNIGMWDDAGDGKYAQYNGVSGVLDVDVTRMGGVPGFPNDAITLVVYGSTTLTTKAAKTQTLSVYNGAVWTDKTVNFGTSIGRVEVDSGLAGDTWSNLESIYSVKLTTNATSGTVKVDYIGFEAEYSDLAKVRGPHGSMNKWILTSINKKVKFDANLDGALIDAGDSPNSFAPNAPFGYPNGGYGSGKDRKLTRVLCFNCHRRDVYDNDQDNFGGTAYTYNPYGRYSRAPHPIEGANHPNSTAYPGDVWSGVWCMNCHGGRVYISVGVGAKPWQKKITNPLHGSFANMTVYNSTSGAVRATLPRPKGVRLLIGANLVGVNLPGGSTTIAATCYTADDEDTMAACAQHGGTGTAKTLEFNYDYTSW